MTPVTLALMFNTTTLIILLVLALLIFGSRLPSLGKNLGKSIVNFKKGMKEASEGGAEEEDEDDDEIEAPRKKPKQLAGETGETAKKREKQRVPADDEDDEA